MLDPQGAVLIESGDARFRWCEGWTALRRRRLHELDDRLLASPSFHDGNTAPGRRRLLYRRGRGNERRGQRRRRREGREQDRQLIFKELSIGFIISSSRRATTRPAHGPKSGCRFSDEDMRPLNCSTADS
jgi:hypothetical protein